MARGTEGRSADRNQRLGQQYGVAATTFHPARDGFGAFARTPEHVAAHDALDRAAGVLGDHETAERALALGPGRRRFQPDRHAEGDVARIDGERASGGERHALRAERTVVRPQFGVLLEEDVGAVARHDLGRLPGMRLEPGTDRRQRHLVPAERPDLDQIAPDGVVRMTVLTGVADPDDRTVVQLHLAGALDLQKELVDRIVDPEQLEAPLLERARFDVAPRIVRYELAAVDAAVDGIAGEVRIEPPEVDAQQIVGRTIKRHRVAPAVGARAVEQRFEIAGEQALWIAAIEHEVRAEALLQESAGLLRRAQGGARRVRADPLPVADRAEHRLGAHRRLGIAPGELLARSVERAERFARVVGAPAGQLIEADRPQLEHG